MHKMQAREENNSCQAKRTPSIKTLQLIILIETNTMNGEAHICR